MGMEGGLLHEIFSLLTEKAYRLVDSQTHRLPGQCNQVVQPQLYAQLGLLGEPPLS